MSVLTCACSGVLGDLLKLPTVSLSSKPSSHLHGKAILLISASVLSSSHVLSSLPNTLVAMGLLDTGIVCWNVALEL